MKKVLAILLIIALGIALGVGVAMLRINGARWNPKPDEGEPAAGSSNTDDGQSETKITQVAPATVTVPVVVCE